MIGWALDSVLNNDCVPGLSYFDIGKNLKRYLGEFGQKKRYNTYLYTNSPASSSPLWVLTFWQKLDAFSQCKKVYYTVLSCFAILQVDDIFPDKCAYFTVMNSIYQYMLASFSTFSNIAPYTHAHTLDIQLPRKMTKQCFLPKEHDEFIFTESQKWKKGAIRNIWISARGVSL